MTDLEGETPTPYDRDHVLTRLSRYCVSKCRTAHTIRYEMAAGEVAEAGDLWHSDMVMPNHILGRLAIMLKIITYLLAFLGRNPRSDTRCRPADFVIDDKIRPAAKEPGFLSISPVERTIAVTPNRAFDGMVIIRA
jgi:hypothetical protein